ncbi:hypothetical protein L1887_15173 [Cichorium endivia]|nr:hypothetical protein L1887_15173 [Cichorium endivia]
MTKSKARRPIDKNINDINNQDTEIVPIEEINIQKNDDGENIRLTRMKKRKQIEISHEINLEDEFHEREKKKKKAKQDVVPKKKNVEKKKGKRKGKSKKKSKLLYCDAVKCEAVKLARKIPVISMCTTDDLENREMEEIISGGFGLGKVVEDGEGPSTRFNTIEEQEQTTSIEVYF